MKSKELAKIKANVKARLEVTADEKSSERTFLKKFYSDLERDQERVERCYSACRNLEYKKILFSLIGQNNKYNNDIAEAARHLEKARNVLADSRMALKTYLNYIQEKYDIPINSNSV